MELSSDSILLGNKVEVKYIIDNLEGNFEAPSFENLRVISGPNVSSSMQIINGVSKSQMSYSYILLPDEIGIFTITPAYLVSEETTLEASPVEIRVYPNPDNIITPLDNNSFNFEFRTDPFKNLDPKPKVPLRDKKLKRI